MSGSNRRMTLGERLERARAAAGLSIRQLEAATGIPRTSITHLLKDRIERPNAESLVKLAQVLTVNPADLFLLAGLPLPRARPSLEAVLRAEYHLPEDGVAEALHQIALIVDKYRPHPPEHDQSRKEDTGDETNDTDRRH